MKRVLLIIGIFVSGFSVLKLIAVFSSDKNLTDFGRGFVTGNIALLILGLAVIFIARKKRT